MWSPGQKDIPQKIHLFADSATAYTAKTTQQLLVEFRFLADWRRYISAKHATHSSAAMKPSLRKIKLKLNTYMVSQQPNTQLQLLFRPKMNFNNT
jgi:hypothetical protein